MSTSRRTVGAPVGRIGRVILVAWAMFLIGGFALARWMNPDPRGYGTHQQLGLPECSFRMIFSHPCPGCGMTTCFAHFVRGNFAAAATANPAGTLLAMVCALLIPWCLISARRGCFWLIEEPIAAATVMIAVVGGIALLSWGVALWRAG